MISSGEVTACTSIAGRVLDIRLQNLQLFVAAGIVDDDLEHETVHLRFGQRVGSLLLDRVLRGHHQERFIQRKGFAADRDLPLLHRFEQRALHLGRGAVDFVGQNQVGEDRPFLNHEFLALGPIDLGSDQIGGQQVGRELQSLKLRVNRLGQDTPPPSSWPAPAHLRSTNDRWRASRSACDGSDLPGRRSSCQLPSSSDGKARCACGFLRSAR